MLPLAALGGRIAGDGPCASGRPPNGQSITHAHHTPNVLCTIALIRVYPGPRAAWPWLEASGSWLERAIDLFQAASPP